MEGGQRTPLLDFFRRSEVARDIRLVAAQGAITPRLIEQLGLLALLTSDQDEEIRQTAEATLARIPLDVISGVIARSDVPTEVRDFFINRGVTAAAAPLPDSADALIDESTGDTPEPAVEESETSIMQRLASMTVPERVKAALKGSREVRAILVRDPNKLVAQAVLSSPKLTETEVESIARMASVSEDVLRTIAQSRAWTKNYGVVSALVRNAKTPVAMSLTLLNRLNEKDLKQLATNRNVPETLRLAARKKIGAV